MTEKENDVALYVKAVTMMRNGGFIEKGVIDMPCCRELGVGDYVAIKDKLKDAPKKSKYCGQLAKIAFVADSFMAHPYILLDKMDRLICDPLGTPYYWAESEVVPLYGPEAEVFEGDKFDVWYGVDGQKTYAYNKLGNRGVAICHEDDKFQYKEGVKIAKERLFRHPSSPEPLREVYYFVNDYMNVCTGEKAVTDYDYRRRSSIHNCFKTRKEAESAALILQTVLKSIPKAKDAVNNWSPEFLKLVYIPRIMLSKDKGVFVSADATPWVNGEQQKEMYRNGLVFQTRLEAVMAAQRAIKAINRVK